MKNDPIVQQVRDTKDQLAAAFDYDVARICADLSVGALKGAISERF